MSARNNRILHVDGDTFMLSEATRLTIITTEPNPMVAAVHNRMPVILGPEHSQWWLQPDRFEPQFLKTLLRPYPAADMACYRVSKLVNNAKHDSPDCLAPG